MILGFALLGRHMGAGITLMAVSTWLAALAHDQDDAAVQRIIGWAVIGAVIYLLIP